MASRRFVMLSLVGLVVSACGGSQQGAGGTPDKGKLVYGVAFDPDKAATVHKGMDKASIETLLGPPFQKSVFPKAPPECNDAWTYTQGFLANHGKNSLVDAFVVLFDPTGVACDVSLKHADTPLK
jgi:hypothetical protein